MTIGDRIIAVAEDYEGLVEVISNAEWDDPKTLGKDTRAAKFEEMLKSAGHEDGWAYCYHQGIKLLTKSGWKTVKELAGSREEIAQVNFTGAASFVSPKGWVIKAGYTGTLCEIKSRGMHIITDDGHRFFGNWSRAKTPALKPIREIGSSLEIPVSFSISEDADISDSDIRIAAAFLADGFYHKGRCEIAVSRNRKIERARKIIPVISESKAKKAYGTSKVPKTTFAFREPESFSRIFSSYKELSWKFVTSLSRRQCVLFLEEYNQWDGAIKSHKSGFNISTSRKQNAEAFATMASLAGMKSNWTKRIAKNGSGKLVEMHGVRATKGVANRSVLRKDVKFYEGTEDLFCPMVDTGMVLIMDLSGAIYVCGNCMTYCEGVWTVAYTEQKASTGLLAQIRGILTPHVMTSYNNALSAGLISRVPERGAIGFMQNGTGSSGHAFLVLGMDNGYINTIEANTSPSAKDVAADRDGGIGTGGVWRKRRLFSLERKLSGLWIKGFLNPISV